MHVPFLANIPHFDVAYLREADRIEREKQQHGNVQPPNGSSNGKYM